MIKIYSNQNLNNEEVIPLPDELYTSDTEWWFIYDNTTKTVIIEPQQCAGYTTSPLTMVVADTVDELNQYITDNDLIYPNSDLPF
jgi:hypothetical protein